MVRNTRGRIVHLERQLQDPSVAEDWLNKGNGLLILPKGQWRRGLSEVEITDWTQLDDEGQPQKIMVELDPKKDFNENAKVCFKHARKIKRAREKVGPLTEEARAAEVTWREAAAKAEACKEELSETGELSETSQELVLALYQRMVDEGVIKRPALPVVVDPEEEARQAFRRKYGKDIDCFLSPNGYEVVAGRSSKMNEHVSLRLAKSDMVWFHSDNGIPGSHVLIRAPWDEVDNEDIMFAAKIAAYHSKGKSRNFVPVMYCKGHQVRKEKGSRTGQVSVTGNSYKLVVPPELPVMA